MTFKHFLATSQSLTPEMFVDGLLSGESDPKKVRSLKKDAKLRGYLEGVGAMSIQLSTDDLQIAKKEDSTFKALLDSPLITSRLIGREIILSTTNTKIIARVKALLARLNIPAKFR